ncbi:enoyl-CoA hydratase [Schauerella aestuarii]|uniref:enoyl-CoA hydratase n=1 Tax=Schauerella aestuarii TaxID=2511204 RepID=UPI00136A422C|nr:enoyl-CoA hydratase [Achromobacter aestuarii]MYZ43976.1 enoyl-CoA hydratase [Achromobacter aestuarii]
MDTLSHPPGRVTFSHADGVARIEIDNPSRFNAMSLTMWQQLLDFVRQADAHPDTRAIVLAGAGERAFVSGADISEFGQQRRDPEQVLRYEHAVADAQAALSNSPHPVIAEIQGVCMGGGLGMALSCDLRYCNRSARFRMPAARLGLGYTLAGVARMTEMIGAARTADLFLTARTFDGAEAARVGVAHEVFDDADFAATVQARIRKVAANAPLTIRAAKLALRHLTNEPDAPSAAQVTDAVRACFASDDYQEGQAAFKAKRPAVFTGR